MRPILSSFLASLIAIFLFAAPASAQVIDRLTADNVGAALNAAGYRYVEATDNRGFPMLRVDGTAIGANNFNVMFYACNAGMECEDITLWSWYSVNGPVDNDFLHVWNDVFRQARNWSRGYVDEDGDPVLIMNINAFGGLGADNLQVLVNTYVAEAQDFRNFIGAQ